MEGESSFNERFIADLEQMVKQQQDKVLDLARRLRPGLTAEDVLNPQDYVELRDNTAFSFEDGVCAGLRSALAAARRRARGGVED